MTPQELAKMHVDAAIALQRYAFERPQRESVRINKLIDAVWMMFLEHEPDQEFVGFLANGVPPLKRLLESRARTVESAKLLADPEYHEAAKRLMKNVEDDHPHTT